MAPDIENPANEQTILEATDNFEAHGYDAQFAAVEGGQVRCFSCRTDTPASDFQIDALNRGEGASDPADMVAVIAAVCSACQAKGTLTLKYGPEATIEEAEVLKQLEDDRNRRSGGTQI